MILGVSGLPEVHGRTKGTGGTGYREGVPGVLGTVTRNPFYTMFNFSQEKKAHETL